MATRAVEIKPLDLRKIRRALGLTMAEMGKKMRGHCEGIGNDTFVVSRISEWEKGHRPVPDYVYRATAYIALDVWRDSRRVVKQDMIPEVDAFFASLLSKAYGALLTLEHQLIKSDAVNRSHLFEVRKIRLIQQEEIENLLLINMADVFASSLENAKEDSNVKVS